MNVIQIVIAAWIVLSVGLGLGVDYVLHLLEEGSE